MEWRRGKPMCRLDVKRLRYADEYFVPRKPSSGNKRRQVSEEKVILRADDIHDSDMSELLKVYWLRYEPVKRRFYLGMSHH